VNHVRQIAAFLIALSFIAVLVALILLLLRLLYYNLFPAMPMS
jgi:hypothetical protein